MIYKGYEITACVSETAVYELDEDGRIGVQVKNRGGLAEIVNMCIEGEGSYLELTADTVEGARKYIDALSEASA